MQQSTASQLRPILPILIGSALMLTLTMGLRQSLGLFMPAITNDISVTVTQFTLAIAIQNLCWGIFQPIVGSLTPRYGFRPVMVGGGAIYLGGMALLSVSQGFLTIVIGAGVMIGIGMACSSTALAMAVTARTVPASIRSVMLGIVSAVGSLGSLIAAPLGQSVMAAFDWRVALTVFAALALLIVPAAWMAGRVDRLPAPPIQKDSADDKSLRDALRMALGDLSFVVMTMAYFVCGMQLIFLLTHLPAYLALCGADPMLAATAIGVIGGMNILGSLFFGWAGGRWSKQALLGMIYCGRSFTIAWYFLQVPTPQNTVIFAAIMGFLWLGVGPLIAGSVAERFGLRWQAMLQGVTFSFHQIGSFLGALGGGLVFDLFGNYDVAVKFGVSLGLFAGIVQIAVALSRRSGTPGAPQPA
ncbi:MFS transporter [Oceanicola sp. 22II-s10i]|uniref:MFS transporter n=1 Tax=Oceanicola sp. 22II-s10i TaxID=1317116 RepID=UPI000B51F454|nr:MFS transporter [Oceanicola sp. 22II-s10i]OWU86254.1 MFS transporter [Oceanicola sp. 22II-s10i]